MTFLNAILAFGAAAFSIPLVIHLLNRSKFQIVEWGAMHLLRATSKVNSRKIQWQHLLLLFLRCMIPVLLALAMARPLIPSWRDSGSTNALSLAIVLDDSQSMFATSKAENSKKAGEKVRTRWDDAIDNSIALLQELPGASTACVVLAGDKPQVLTSHVPDTLVDELRKLKRRKNGAGPLQLDAGIRDAVQWLNSTVHTKRHLTVVSDFQASDWRKELLPRDRQLADLIASQSVKPKISWIDVGTESSEATLGNVSVESIQLSPAAFGPGQEVVVTVTMKNHSSQAWVPKKILLFVEDDEVEKQEVAFAENSTSVVRFHWKPSTVGDKAIRVTVEVDDDLLSDNELTRVARVQQVQRVLLVDGDRRNEPMMSESDFLRLALAPYSILQSRQGDLFSTRVVTIGEVNEAMLAEFDLIAMCNVSDVNETIQSWLRRRVEAGGGLIFFMGDRVNTNQYQSWPVISAGGLRPGKWGTRLATKLHIAKPANSALSLSSSTIDSLIHANLDYFTPISELDTKAQTVLALEENAPWIMETTIGKGVLMWFTTSCDVGDSNLPTKTGWLPLMQRVASHALHIDTVADRLEPGQVWQRDTGSLKLEAGAKVRIEAPDGQLAEVIASWGETPDNAKTNVVDSSISFDGTRLLGLYKTSTTPVLLANVAMSPDSTTFEHELARLPSQDLKDRATGWGATVVQDSNQWLSQVRSNWSGREVWTWFWTLLLVFFLAEIALQQRISPRRKVNSVGVSDPLIAPSSNRGAA